MTFEKLLTTGTSTVETNMYISSLETNNYTLST